MKQTVYIFDVDGVLNDFAVYDPDPRILDYIALLMEKGTFVAINTGRGYQWTEEKVVAGIRQRLKDANNMDRLFVAVEMGGLGVEFAGSTETKIRSAFSLTEKQVQGVKQIFEQHPKYADTMHWYPKETMATLDRNETGSMEAYRTDQEEMAALLRGAFKDEHAKVNTSTDAIDVFAPEAGKWAGAQLIYDWLRRVTDVKHDHYVCFGDSKSDYEMARFFAAQSHDAEFILTGESLDGVSLDEGIRVTKTSKLYSHGAVEYLQSRP
jgi:hydroxymethylpyrimidine pyrophosphatase-like HAD family hydrolase